MPKRINITFNNEGLGTIQCVGLGTFPCGGKAGLQYPTDLTISQLDKKGTHFSREYQVDMPYAILLWGQRGVYLHQWPQLEGSAGCIHVLKDDAKQIYDFVDQSTRIVISYTW